VTGGFAVSVAVAASVAVGAGAPRGRSQSLLKNDTGRSRTPTNRGGQGRGRKQPGWLDRRIVGAKLRQMTQRDAHATTADLRAAIDKLAR
jgi:hypothetical protein